VNRDFTINLDAKKTSQGFVESFTQNQPVISPPEMARSDSFPIRLLFVRLSPGQNPDNPFYFVDPSTFSSVKFAGGIIGETPDGGSFTLTSSISGTTGGVDYDAAFGTLQTAIQGLGGLGSATVTGSAGGPWFVDSNSTSNATLAITGSAAALAPDGSTVVIIKTQTANGSLTNRWEIRLAKALPILKTTGWTALPAASVSTSVVQAGSASANKTFRLTWNADAYAGSVMLSFTGDTTTDSVGPIAYSANASDIVASFAPHVDVGDNGVAAVKNGPGDFTITCIGAGIKNNNTPALSSTSNTLSVPVGLTAVVTVSTAGADDILNGADSANITFEVEIGESSGQKNTVAQMGGKLLGDLILDTPGQATGNENYLTSQTGVQFLGSITEYIGGTSDALDSIPTDDLTVPQLFQFVHDEDGLRTYLLRVGSTAEDATFFTIIRPDDFNASTNAKVYQSVG